MDQSAASADLYTMYRDFAVHRRQRRGNGTYEYWLTDDGVDALEESGEPIEPDPFEESEAGDAEGDEAET